MQAKKAYTLVCLEQLVPLLNDPWLQEVIVPLCLPYEIYSPILNPLSDEFFANGNQSSLRSQPPGDIRVGALRSSRHFCRTCGIG
jgi:hypothetical protein